MIDVTLAIVLFLLLSLSNLVYASLFEWHLHKYVMHRPILGFMYPYRAHALTHHGLFSGLSYHMRGTDNKEKVRMAWWNGPVIVLIGVMPFVVAAVIVSNFGWNMGCWIILASGIIVSAGYFTAYEYFHWCMHVPKNRWFEMTKWFRRINGHHILHHRFPDRNFNVVLPIADFLLGTLVVRSPVKFAQVQGPSVPDLQPP